MTIDFADMFEGSRVMAILRGLGATRTLEITRVAWSAGVRTVEVPLQSAADLESLRLVVEAARLEGRPVGAGTIIDRSGVTDSLEAGAVFTVSPGWDPEVARASLDAGLAHLPGVATGSEVQAVRRFGLRWVKAFPAAQLGPDWIRAMRGPFPDMSFVATGGVTTGSGQAFFDAGASAIAIGSALADPHELDGLHRLMGESR